MAIASKAACLLLSAKPTEMTDCCVVCERKTERYRQAETGRHAAQTRE